MLNLLENSFPEILGAFFTAIVGVIIYYYEQKTNISKKYSDTALNIAFIPISSKMDTIIFKRITADNKHLFTPVIQELIILLKHNNTEIYYPEFFLIYLQDLEVFIQKNKYTNATRTLYNLSTLYWKSFNKCRKHCGLPKRTINYRIHNDMHFGGSSGILILASWFLIKLLSKILLLEFILLFLYHSILSVL